LSQKYAEWDENKNRSNQQKHVIPFEEAKEVFDDDNAVAYLGYEKDGENRILLVGKTIGRLMIAVVFTMRKQIYAAIRPEINFFHFFYSPRCKKICHISKKSYLCTGPPPPKGLGLPAILIAKGMVAKAAASFNALPPAFNIPVRLGGVWGRTADATLQVSHKLNHNI
jgi:uncharacterized DUF497 family protein